MSRQSELKRATANVHGMLLDKGFYRDPANDIKGAEYMLAYAHDAGHSALQHSGLTVLMFKKGRTKTKHVFNAVKDLKAVLYPKRSKT